MAGSFFSFNSAVLPAPSLASNNTATIKLVDPVLYALATSFAQYLNTNLSPRFEDECTHCNLTHANLDNFVDGYAVAQIIAFPLSDIALKDNDFKFPLLNVVIEHEEPIQLTLTNVAMKRDFCVSWVLPPLTTRQNNRIYHFLQEAAKIWTVYGQQGYDPKTSSSSIWATVNVSYGSLNSVDYGEFDGFDKAGKEANFPCVQFRLSLIEKNQLPVLSNFSVPFTSLDLQLNLVDGYSPGNPIDNFIEMVIPARLSLASVYPAAGSSQGGTQITIMGTGFASANIKNPLQLTVCGVPVVSLVVLSPTVIQAITNPAISSTIGTAGNIVLTDQYGNNQVLSAAYTYQ